ncbi:DUF327 family protein [Bacillus sp. HMF5848]|uniref:YaaR family protein n=1 Tax=Bacillus sp. HMF5848 TaxID=2495421 RepID=UPI000F775A22|nr:YaaR family protein [Bacillus sp. HMF5848]RSK25464.1 DUF327 family protein [Bacillus sp. HMF5848]
MKIDKELRTALDVSKYDSRLSRSGQKGFADMVQQQGRQLQLNELHALMKDIEVAGERLARSRTFQDLARFKGFVKKYIKQAVDYGLNIKESHSWSFEGQGRRLQIVEQVEKELLHLTDDIMQKEAPSIDILDKIGEIKGLLINIYT